MAVTENRMGQQPLFARDNVSSFLSSRTFGTGSNNECIHHGSNDGDETVVHAVVGYIHSHCSISQNERKKTMNTTWRPSCSFTIEFFLFRFHYKILKKVQAIEKAF